MILGGRTGSALITEADAMIWGANPGENVGAIAVPAGDINGDGLPDLALGVLEY